MPPTRKPMSKSFDQFTTIIATLLTILVGGIVSAILFGLGGWALTLPPIRCGVLGAALGMIAVILRLWQVRQ